MKNSILLSLIIFLILSSPACQKVVECNGSGCLVFGGIITDAINGKPLKDADITVYKHEGSGFSLRRLVGEGTTGNDGRYNVTFDGTGHETNDGSYS
ncbi:MAG: hypothetical protein AB8F74_21080, partial [Saprospiraceae bacterium]